MPEPKELNSRRITVGRRFFLGLMVFMCLWSPARGQVDWTAYHVQVRAAEREMMGDSMVSACTRFQDLFAEWDRPFQEDIRSAIIAATYAGEWEQAKTWMLALRVRGESWKYLRKLRRYLSQPASLDWRVLKQEWADCEPEPIPPACAAIRTQVLAMFEEDQRIRKQGSKKGVDSPMGKERDAAHRVELRRIINEYGYPGSQMPGADADSRAAIFILMLHAANAPDFYTEGMRDTLRSEIRAGRLHPRSFACFEDRFMWCCDSTLYASQWKWPLVTEARLSRISDSVNARRREIGLEPYELERRRQRDFSHLFRNVVF